MRARIKSAMSRAKYAAIGAAIGAAVGGLISRNAASTGGALGGLTGATLADPKQSRWRLRGVPIGIGRRGRIEPEPESGGRGRDDRTGGR